MTWELLMSWAKFTMLIIYRIHTSMSNYKYEDENAKTLIDGMWSKTYNAIANSNNLLSRIGSEDPQNFQEEKWRKHN